MASRTFPEKKSAANDAVAGSAFFFDFLGGGEDSALALPRFFLTRVVSRTPPARNFASAGDFLVGVGGGGGGGGGCGAGDAGRATTFRRFSDTVRLSTVTRTRSRATSSGGVSATTPPLPLYSASDKPTSSTAAPTASGASRAGECG